MKPRAIGAWTTAILPATIGRLIEALLAAGLDPISERRMLLEMTA